MAPQDYAKRLSTAKKRKQSKRRFRLHLKILFGIVVLGLLILVVCVAQLAKKSMRMSSDDHSIIARALHTKSVSEAIPNPKFDFYTMLTRHDKGMSIVSDPAQSIARKELLPKSIERTPEQIARQEVALRLKRELALPNPRYQLVIGAFKNARTAKKLRHYWQKKGFATHANSVKIHGTVLYRVWLGPYDSLMIAKMQQRRLTIQSLIVLYEVDTADKQSFRSET